MNKQEAAKYLACSVRAIERYTQKGRLSATYVKGKTSPAAEYREEDLRALKVELDAELYPQRPSVEKPLAQTFSDNLAHNPASLATLSAGASSQSDFAALIGVIVRESVQAASAGVPIADKVMLNLADASALSSLSRGHLLAAIHTGKLQAKIIGRGWRIKRASLDAYVQKL